MERGDDSPSISVFQILTEYRAILNRSSDMLLNCQSAGVRDPWVKYLCIRCS